MHRLILVITYRGDFIQPIIAKAGPAGYGIYPMHEIPLLQVSELTGLIKNLLEGSLPAVRVEGELSNWRPAPSGHVYCTLKDMAGGKIGRAHV